jgi:hypothetical protein
MAEGDTMSENTHQEQVQSEQVQETTTEETTVDVQEQIKKEIEALKEQSKKEIAGLNKRNSELEKLLQQKDLEKLTEEERLKKEVELARQEKERIEKETKELNRQRLIDKSLFDAGLPQDFAKRITGDDVESIQNDVKAIEDFLNQQAEKKAEALINKRLAGVAPEQGAQTPAGTLSAEEIAALPPEQRREHYKKAGYL